MNLRYGVFYLFLVISAAVVCAEETVHIVQRGETIYSIARSYSVNSEELMKLNGITNAQKLQIGRRLTIPGAREHRVAQGETLYGIARRYEITVQALRNANDLSNKYILKEGDVLRIPRNEAKVERVEVSVGKDTAIPPPVSVPERRVDAAIRWPVAAKEVVYMTGKLYGVVLMGEKSEAVKSLTQGTIVSAGPYRGFGRVAIVQVTGGYLYVYGGCESLSVKEGDRVVSGTELGRLGIDAVSKKPQLFFLVYRGATPIDPAKAPRA
ncbi:MAG: M23 family metallopeptidase [Treponema sp.]|jgi:murein DD-endopeptidase MepM/ murein hydrolase activator NlpD|nr:M23 family metallopeptidase [Treponema sp.]